MLPASRRHRHRVRHIQTYFSPVIDSPSQPSWILTRGCETKPPQTFTEVNLKSLPATFPLYSVWRKGKFPNILKANSGRQTMKYHSSCVNHCQSNAVRKHARSYSDDVTNMHDHTQMSCLTDMHKHPLMAWLTCTIILWEYIVTDMHAHTRRVVVANLQDHTLRVYRD